MAAWLKEAQYQQAIIELAELHGWRVYHVANVKGKLRGRTSPGFPDLVLARDAVWFVEVKLNGRQPDPDQVAWLNTLLSAGHYAAVWRPADWPEIRSVLSSPAGDFRSAGCWLGPIPRFGHEWKGRLINQ